MADDAPKKKSGLKLGSKVWVRDVDVANPEVFILATLQGIAGKFAQIETVSGDKFETDLFFPANPEGQEYNDHTALLHLSDATLLENSRIRYAKDEIYTFVGPILISVNPFKYIEHLYRPELMAQCRKFSPGHPERPAHTFSMAEAAYQQLAKQKHSQSLVVSGESGAGKTEVNKQCMNYLVWRACDASSDLANRILESNPVLEGLGNAKTVRNNNSSRFGKFVTMRFEGVDTSNNPKLVGAEIQTFLLEKSRVVATTAKGERNYHVFYHVLKGGGYMAGDNPDSCRLLNRSQCTVIPRVDDLEEYHAIVKAMVDVGVPEPEVAEVCQAIAGILALGNLSFGDEENDAQAYVSDPDECKRAADLLGSSLEAMEKALLRATLKVSASESYEIELDPTKAALGRDAYCKAIYQRIFDHLVNVVNNSLALEMPGASSDLKFIGLLDVFGFEIFEVNSFEQLCINFANEKLQNFFLRSVFKAEELAYKNDGIKFEAITYTDNSSIIEICEGKEKGIFPSLDSVCKAPKATDETLANQLHENHGKSKILCRPKAAKGAGGKKGGITDKEGFILKHFAGDVTYAVANWLDKNNDKLSEDYEKHLASSTKDLVKNHIAKKEEADAGPGPKKGGKGKPKAAQTVSRSFLASLKKLLDALESTDAHFIRCIKPNNELKPNKLYGAFVLNQLKCSGTLEAVELMQKGYPSRIPYSSIHEKYKGFMPDFVQALPPSEFVEAIALAYGVQKEDYQLGMYKIFMRAGKAAFLEELKDANLDEMVPIIVKKIEEFQKRKRGKLIVERSLVTWIWRRRIRKLRAMKKELDDLKRKRRSVFLGAAAKKRAGERKKELAKKQEQLAAAEIDAMLREMPMKKTKDDDTTAASAAAAASGDASSGGAKGAATRAQIGAPPAGSGGGKKTNPRMALPSSGAAPPQQQRQTMAGGADIRATAAGLPQLSALSYGPRVVSKRAPIDPNDKSAFTINIPQGAKSIIKQAVEEYKQTNAMGQDEVGLLDRFLQNLGSATAPTTIFGVNPNAPVGSGAAGAVAPQATGASDPGHLMDEITDAPQLFEYDDIKYSGHMLVKVVDLFTPPPKAGKKPSKKKKEEWSLEYFILLNTKHMIHFLPNTGFVDPFAKTVSGKSIDLMQAQVSVGDGAGEAVDIPSALLDDFAVDALEDGFEIRTARHKYILKPKETSADVWMENITDVMFDSVEDDANDEEVRDYGDFLVGYNDVVESTEGQPA